MEKKILIPITPSLISREAIKKADQWSKRTGAELFFMHVRSGFLENYGNHKGSGREKANSIQLAEEKDRELMNKFIQAQKVTSKYHVNSLAGTTYLKIIEEEKRIGADLILMPSHSHTLMERLFLGSNTDYTVNNCSCPIYVHRRSTGKLTNLIIVPVDYSEINKKVIELAGNLAEKSGDELIFVHVAREPQNVQRNLDYVWQWEIVDEKSENKEEVSIRNLTLEQKDKLEVFIASLKIRSKYQIIAEFGKPYLQILKQQKINNAKLIMVSDRSHNRLKRYLLGSVTDYILHHSTCSVYVYKEN